MESTQQLLRTQALTAQSSNALGSVVFVTPTSLRLSLVFIIALLLAIAAFLYLGKVSTVTVLSGKLAAADPGQQLTTGVTALIQKFLVDNGQAVKAGEPLLQFCPATPSMTLNEPDCTGPSTTLAAPYEGRVELLSIGARDMAPANAPVMYVHPAAALMVASLRVPEKDIGELRPGQKVRMRYGRYSAAKYQDEYGEVVKVGAAPLKERPVWNPAGTPPEDHYQVMVRPQRQFVQDRDGRNPLMLNMSVQASVVTRETPIYLWLWSKV